MYFHPNSTPCYAIARSLSDHHAFIYAIELPLDDINAKLGAIAGFMIECRQCSWIGDSSELKVLEKSANRFTGNRRFSRKCPCCNNENFRDLVATNVGFPQHVVPQIELAKQELAQSCRDEVPLAERCVFMRVDNMDLPLPIDILFCGFSRSSNQDR
jgi:hypothetical protein